MRALQTTLHLSMRRRPRFFLMISEPSPALTQHNSVDSLRRDAVSGRDGNMRLGQCASADGQNVGLGQLTFCLPSGHSLFSRSVRHVCRLSADRQMLDVHTRRVIAGVHHNKAMLYFAVSSLPGKTMGADFLAAMADNPVIEVARAPLTVASPLNAASVGLLKVALKVAFKRTIDFLRSTASHRNHRSACGASARRILSVWKRLLHRPATNTSCLVGEL